MQRLLSLGFLLVLLSSVPALAQDNGDYPTPAFAIEINGVWVEIFLPPGPEILKDCAVALETLTDPIRGPLSVFGTCLDLLVPGEGPPPQDPPDPPGPIGPYY